MQPTVAAIITPPGEGGIGIVAVAGPDAARTVDAVFAPTRRAAAELGPGQIAHGKVRRAGRVVDEVLVARIVGDGAERYEVNCHGGPAAVHAVLDCLAEAGARRVPDAELHPPAGDAPLEADSVRAAALRALPRAVTRLAALTLLHQAGGALAGALLALRGDVARGAAAAAHSRLDALLATWPLGRALLSPPRVALLGPPNAGKSTLMNALLEQERLLVHAHPGTTRDVVQETVSLGGVPFQLTDAAGVRPAVDAVESLAVDRAVQLAGQCEVALLVFDLCTGPGPALALRPKLAEGARAILVGAKADLPGARPRQPDAAPDALPFVPVSAHTGEGIEDLERELLRPYAQAVEQARAGGPVVFDKAAAKALRAVREALEGAGSTAAARAILRGAGGEGTTPTPRGRP